MLKFRILIIFITATLFVTAQTPNSQNDSLRALKPSLPYATLDTSHSPKRATIMSAACPGLGQIYNKSAWKVPVIYLGFAALGYGANFYHNQYIEFRDVYYDYRNPYLLKKETPPTNVTLTVFGKTGYYPANVKEGRDYYRRNRDLCIIGIGAWYVLNILEAYVDANMFNFDTSNDLSLRIQPTLYESSQTPLGLKLNLTF